MPNPPAQCNNCGSWFSAPGIVVESFAELHGAGATVGPCDRCGGNGTIPGGVFRAVGDTLQWIIDVEDPREIQRLLDAAKSLRDRGADIREVRETLEEAAPKPGLSRFLPQNAGEVGIYLTALIMALSLMYDVASSGDSVDQQQIIDAIVEQLKTEEP